MMATTPRVSRDTAKAEDTKADETKTDDLKTEETESTVTEDSSPEERYGEAPDGWQRDEDGGISAVEVPWKGYV